MINARHLVGNNLALLEQQLGELSKSYSIVITQWNKVGGNWYVHYLIQAIADDKLEKGTLQSAEKTKTVKKVRKKKVSN